MNKKVVITAIVLVVLAGGYFVTTNISQAPTQTVSPTDTSTKVLPQTNTTTATQGVKEITVTGTEFAFSPSEITVKAGEKIKLNFNNDGSYLHNWVVEGQGIETKKIPGGAGDVIEFTAPAKGTYTFFCSVFGHRDRGMTGTLIVE